VNSDADRDPSDRDWARIVAQPDHERSTVGEKIWLYQAWSKQPGAPAWLGENSLSARDLHGAINLEWHGRSNTLICRVVTKLGHKPNSITAISLIICSPATKAAFSPSTLCGDRDQTD